MQGLFRLYQEIAKKFVYAAFQLAQSVFLFTGYLQGVSRDLDEAAIIDGANDLTLLFRILMPVSKPIMSTVAVLCFVYCYGELMFSMTLLTDVDKFTVSRAMLTFQGEELQLGPIFACIIIAVVPIIVFYLAFHEKVQDFFTNKRDRYLSGETGPEFE